MMEMRWILCVLILIPLPDFSDASAQTAITKDLYSYLFTNYTKNLIPICTTGGNVTLTVDIALRQVMEVNEREQILSTNVWLRLNWDDCRLTWDPSLYNNLTYIMVTYNDVWIPDITLYDSAADEVMFPGREDYRAYISSSGSVTYNFPTVLTSICRVNVRHFPFDTQRCQLQFGSWSHHGYELDVVSKNPNGTNSDLANFIENNEWIVDEFPVERHVLYYNCCPEPYPDVTFYVVLERRPAFYLLTMLFPCILVSIVAALVFLLPAESGEKISLEITVLLSLAVFLLLVSETLPPASDNFPVIGEYFASSMVLVSLSLIQTILVMNVFYRGTDGRQVPKWARILFFKYLGKLVCGKDINPDAVGPEKETSTNSSQETNVDDKDDSVRLTSKIGQKVVSENDVEFRNGKRQGVLPSLAPRDSILVAVERQSQYLQNVEKIFKAKDSVEENNSDWRDIANIMDRLFLILYVVVTLITTLSFLLQAK